MKTSFRVASGIALSFAVAGCSSTGSDSSFSANGSESAASAPTTPGTSAGPTDTGSASPGEPGLAASKSSNGSGKIQSGTLTAGVWDDNRNYDFFTSFRTEHQQDDGAVPLTDDEIATAHTLAIAPASAKQKLDVQIVIDTTGSMGDEIAYLDSEFNDVVATIQTKYPSADSHWSLVAYKDKLDTYVARTFDFSADPAQLRAGVSTLEASGGGDFPESPEVALDKASRLSWRVDADTARLVFWVADAPHHAADASAMATALRELRDEGVHVYPVAASGIDPFTEFTMRGAAQITGGRYVFLTDDSGVGDSHEVPSVPCYFVTELNDAILRMVDIEMTGAYREPTAAEVIRTGGDPKSGVCRVADTTATIY